MRVLVLTSRDIYGRSGEATLMREKEAALKAMGCSVAYLSCRWRLPNEPGDESIIYRFPTWQWLLNPLGCYARLRSLVDAWLPDVLVVSGHWLKFHPWIIGRIKRHRPMVVSLDLQGAIEEWSEYSLLLGSRTISRAFQWLIAFHEAGLLRHIDLIEVVSPNFKRYVQEKYSRFEGDIVVVPCGVTNVFDDAAYGELRSTWRSKLKIGPDETAAVYSGGLSRWQRIEDVLAFARDNQWLKVFLLTNGDLGQLGEELPPNVRSRSLPREEAIEALCAFDYGFLLRYDDLTNHVAFPNKASEYLNARLKIVIDSRNLGCVLPEFSHSFISVDEVVLIDQHSTKPAYAISNIRYQETVWRLLSAYRLAAPCARRPRAGTDFSSRLADGI